MFTLGETVFHKSTQFVFLDVSAGNILDWWSYQPTRASSEVDRKLLVPLAKKSWIGLLACFSAKVKLYDGLAICQGSLVRFTSWFKLGTLLINGWHYELDFLLWQGRPQELHSFLFGKLNQARLCIEFT